MLIRLLPSQIPTVWNHIKYAVSKVMQLSGDDYTRYIVKLIHSLLTEKSQCFVRLNDERKLTGVTITKIVVDNYTKERKLIIDIVYSYEHIDENEWQSYFEIIRDFAVKNNCVEMETNSGVARVHQIANMTGFVEKTRTYSLKLGGN